MRLLAVGDVFGEPGRRAIERWLPGLRERLAADVVVVNVENMHGGKGVDPTGARAVLESGADCMTSGNHVFAHKAHAALLDREERLVRPLNYPEPCPGRGATVIVSPGGVRVGVVNLIGRLFLGNVDDPFTVAVEAVERLRRDADVIVVDFHAEATSEKLALAHHLDGSVAALFGTHTHVQTADARVLPRGTGFISDLGMTGPYDSVIGMETRGAVTRFLTGRPARTKPATGEPGLRGALFEIDEGSGLCTSVERVAKGGGGR